MDDVGTIQVPSWFPYEGSVYNTFPQCSNDVLRIPVDSYKMFHNFNTEYLLLIYRAFFQVLHQKAKHLTPSYKQRGLKYWLFTPPWIRKTFCVGSEFTQMEKVVIPDKKGYRNKMGYRRKKVILAAYRHKEPHFGKSVLERLVRRMPALRAEEARRRRSLNLETLESVTVPTTSDRPEARRNDREQVVGEANPTAEDATAPNLDRTRNLQRTEEPNGSRSEDNGSATAAPSEGSPPRAHSLPEVLKDDHNMLLNFPK